MYVYLLRRMNKFTDIPKAFFIEVINSLALQKHINRVSYFKRIRAITPTVDYIEKLAGKVIGFDEFLRKQHNRRIKECAELILFKKPEYFYEACSILSSQNRLEGLQSLYLHEMLHYEKCTRYDIPSYIGIKFPGLKHKTESLTFQIHATLISLFEKKAKECGWNLEKYLETVKNCANISNPSSGDRKTLKTIFDIKKSYNLK